MLQFFKDSLRELQHVVWPTRKETQNYFVLVLMVLVFFGLYLFLFSNMFSQLIFGLKSLFIKNTYTPNPVTTSEQNIPENTEVSIMSDEVTPTVEPIDTVNTEEIQTGAIDQ